MDQGKERIKELFFKNVYGLSPNIDGYDKKHAGAKGHWLEKQLGKTTIYIHAMKRLGMQRNCQKNII